MAKLCPFRKRSYADNWTVMFKDMTIVTEQHEEFEECIEKECQAWCSTDSENFTGYCQLCTRKG